MSSGMSEDFVGFIKKRADKSFRYLLREIEVVSAQDAFEGRRENWLNHKWGVGQNGSIAGIVYHVAAWKSMTRNALNSGVSEIENAPFDPSIAPSPDDWSSLRAWLSSVGEEWNSAVQSLPEMEFERALQWEGHIVSVCELVSEMYEHDIQHASQVEYIKQLQLASKNKG